MGMASAITDVLKRLPDQEKARLSHYKGFLDPTPTAVGDVGEAVGQALSTHQIQFIETIILEIAGDFRNYHFPLPATEALTASED